MFSRRDASKQRKVIKFWPLPRKIKVKFWPHVTWGQVILKSTGDQRRPKFILIDAYWPAGYNETIRSLHPVSVRCYQQKTHVTLHDLKWPWSKVTGPDYTRTSTLTLDPSLYFRMITDETVAAPTQSLLWIAIQAWHDIEKESQVTGHWDQGHDIFSDGISPGSSPPVFSGSSRSDRVQKLIPSGSSLPASYRLFPQGSLDRNSAELLGLGIRDGSNIVRRKPNRPLVAALSDHWTLQPWSLKP